MAFEKKNSFSHIHLLNELKFESEDWFNYLRMDEATYLELLNLVAPLIEKKSTQLREAISPHERLIAIPGHGEKLRGPQIFSSSFCSVIRSNYPWNLCCYIYTVLKKDYLKVCTTNFRLFYLFFLRIIKNLLYK